MPWTSFCIVRAAVFLGSVAVAGALDAGEPRWVEYGPAVVTLSGRLVAKEFFGPPGYGEAPETDSREVARLLVIDEPLHVRADHESDINSLEQRNVREVQLVWSQKAGPLLGRRVRVRGTLFAGHTGHHHVDLLVIVALIEPLE